MKIDLHVHDKERSACSKSSEDEQIRAAIKFGLDGLIFTDHNILTPLEHLKELNDKFKPFKIYGGIEIEMQDTHEHILVLGLHDKILQDKKWVYEELHSYVRQNNGYIAFAHPFRYKDFIKENLEKFIPDAIEIHSTNIGIDDTEKIKQLAKKLNTNLIANSDAHHYSKVGIYCNDLAASPNSEKELIELLKKGAYKISSDSERIRKHNDEVNKKELLIKKLIKENKDKIYYHEITGSWEGEFERVAQGKTYKI